MLVGRSITVIGFRFGQRLAIVFGLGETRGSMHKASFICPYRPWRVVIQQVKDYTAACAIHGGCQDRGVEWIGVRWISPEEGWVCLNTDGAIKSSPKLAGCGGIIWDHSGSWLGGFSKFIGFCNPLVAELWGCLLGLCLCYNKGWHRLLVQLDARVACLVIQAKELNLLAVWSNV